MESTVGLQILELIDLRQAFQNHVPLEVAFQAISLFNFGGVKQYRIGLERSSLISRSGEIKQAQTNLQLRQKVPEVSDSFQSF